MLQVILVLLLACGSAQAYELEALLKDARAHHDKAMASFQDLTLEYSGTLASAPGQSGQSTIKSTMYRKGEQWRMEGSMNLSGGSLTVNGEEQPEEAMNLETVMIFDGQDVWTSAMGMKMKMPKDQAEQQMGYSEYWREPPAGSKVLGEETVGGRACWIVEYPAAGDMEPVKFWIDKERFIHVRSESKLSGTTITSVFSDFKAVKGDFVIPYHVEVLSGGSKTMDVTVTKVALDRGLSDDLFSESSLSGGSMDLDLEKLMKQAEEMQKKYQQDNED